MSERCVYFACDDDGQGDREGHWWVDYGTCSREHAVEHYGEGAVE